MEVESAPSILSRANLLIATLYHLIASRHKSLLEFKTPSYRLPTPQKEFSL